MIGFMLAVALRVAIGGVGVAYASSAGLVFAAALTIMTLAAGVRTVLSWRVVGFGLAGAAVLLLVPLVSKLLTSPQAYPDGNYGAWAATVGCVAFAEEAFLRGALFQALAAWRGPAYAVVITAVLFAVLHIPLYGWHVIPLDFMVGLWLGVLRTVAGSWLAPGFAHCLADLITWWLI
jgi:membrane protease YdiL (CAAX protease family)